MSDPTSIGDGLSAHSSSIANIPDGLSSQATSITNHVSGQSGSVTNMPHGASILSGSSPSVPNGMSGPSSYVSSSTSIGSGHGVPMFVKIIGGIMLLVVVVHFIRRVRNKRRTHKATIIPTAGTTPRQYHQPYPQHLRRPAAATTPQSQLVAGVTTSTQPVTATPSSVMQRIPTPIGCYTEKSDRAMPTYLGLGTFEYCNQNATDKGYKYFALQNGQPGTTVAQCFVSNDIISSQRHGIANNCIALPGTNNFTGGAWSNYVYGV